MGSFPITCNKHHAVTAGAFFTCRRQRKSRACQVTPTSREALRARETPGSDALPPPVPGLSSPWPSPIADPGRPPTGSAAPASPQVHPARRGLSPLPRPPPAAPAPCPCRRGTDVWPPPQQRPPPYRACSRGPQGSPQEHGESKNNDAPSPPLPFSLRPPLALRAAARRRALRMRWQRASARAYPCAPASRASRRERAG